MSVTHQVERKDRIDALGGSFLVGFSVLLGLNQALVKIVNDGFAPVFQTGMRSACAFLLVLAWVYLRRIKIDWRNGTIALGSLLGLLFALEFGLLFTALEFTTVSRVSLLFYTMPFYVAVASHFMFGERLTLIRLAGLGLAIGGIALVMSGRDGGLGSAEQTLIGDLLCIGAALAWAGITIVTRGSRLIENPPEQNLIYQLAVSGLVMLIVAPLVGDTVRELTPSILGIFAFQVVAIASIGFLVWLWVLSVYPVSDMASFSLLSPLFGVLFGWILFDDPLTLEFAAAMTLVCGGLLLINRRPTTQ